MGGSESATSQTTDHRDLHVCGVSNWSELGQGCQYLTCKQITTWAIWANDTSMCTHN